MKRCFNLLTSIFILASTVKAISNDLANGQLSVHTKVSRICYVEDADLNFGTIDGMFLSDTRAHTFIHVTCTEGAHYYLTLNTGNHDQSGIRRLKSTGSESYIEYFLFQPDMVTPWNLDSYIYSIGTGEDQAFKVHGLIPSGQKPVSGGYDYNDYVLINLYLYTPCVGL